MDSLSTRDSGGINLIVLPEGADLLLTYRDNGRCIGPFVTPRRQDGSIGPGLNCARNLVGK